MRIALLADIHGNSIALQTALDDIQKRGTVDAYWVMGDLCAVGYDPIGVLEQLDNLPNLTVIKGNADRYVTTFDMPPPSIDDAKANPDLIPILAEVYGNFHWTRGALDATGWTDWLAEKPFDCRQTLPDGTVAYLVHSMLDTDEGKGLNPARTDDELDELLADLPVQVGLICVGHFHMPMHRYYRHLQIVNPGSISNTFHKDSHAYYAILDADEVDLAFYAVKYDLAQATIRLKKTLNIGNDYNLRIMSGDVVPSWKAHWDGVAHLPEIVMT